MSQENVEIARRGYDAWNRGDLDEWLVGFAPEGELHTTGQFPDQGVYRGRAGLERYWAEIHEAAEELSLSVNDVRASGDKVFMAVTARGRGKLSAVPTQSSLVRRSAQAIQSPTPAIVSKNTGFNLRKRSSRPSFHSLKGSSRLSLRVKRMRPFQSCTIIVSSPMWFVRGVLLCTLSVCCTNSL